MPITLIISLLSAASQLLPELETAVPIVHKAVAGHALTPADLAQLESIAASLNAQAAAGAKP